MRRRHDPVAAATKAANTARGEAILVIDDEHAMPEVCTFAAALLKTCDDLTPRRRPGVVYVTAAYSARGAAWAQADGRLCGYVRRDADGHWVGEAAGIAIASFHRSQQPDSTEAPGPLPAARIVGTAPVFVEAVAALTSAMRTPYALLTGAAGTGKMFLIRALWRQIGRPEDMIVLPCGSFFQDYYLGGQIGKIGGGRQAVDDLEVYLEEAQDGLLVLHHVERLPLSVQETLAVRLQEQDAQDEASYQLRGVAKGGLGEHDVRIVATSTLEIGVLANRMLPELFRRLPRQHIHLPSLDERGPDDIRQVSEDILARIAARHGRRPWRLDSSAVNYLTCASWPGNVSELVSTLERATRACRGDTIQVKHLPSLPVAPRPPRTLNEVIKAAKQEAIRNALKQFGGNISQAAKHLGRDRAGLHRLMKTLGITADEPRSR